jgi:hypothetical protein
MKLPTLEKTGLKIPLEHAAERSVRRYGLVLTPELSAQLLYKAKTDPIKRQYRQIAQRWICTIKIERQTYRIVCDRNFEKIITFLPRKKKFRGLEK